MPRLPTQLLIRGRRLQPLIALLLGTCRDLASARNEFRWLRDHAFSITINGFRASVELRKKHGVPLTPRQDAFERKLCRNAYSKLLRSMCIERGRGKPLQYILGTEYFGELEILCKQGVLIPRPETANMVIALAEKLATTRKGRDSSIKVLDLCTGTGCISFLMHQKLRNTLNQPDGKPDIEILGIDISPKAVKLASANLQHLTPSLSQPNISFVLADVLPVSGSSSMPSLTSLLESRAQTSWDIVISNPPYISPLRFLSPLTTRSVRKFEPRLALVPPEQPVEQGEIHHRGDHFYPVLLAHAAKVNAKVVLLEVGDYEQALRVSRMAINQYMWTGGVEIWKDDLYSETDTESIALPNGQIMVKGVGAGRAVVCWKDEWLSA